MSDPLHQGPEQERALYDAFRRAAAGRNVDAVFGACINMLVNAIRQMEPTRSAAEARWDALFGRGKSLLLERHYDSVSGKRRTVFPFTQVVKMPYHHEDDEVHG